MSADEDALLAALGGGDGTLVDQVDDALAIAWRLASGLNLTLPASGGSPGPYRPGGTPWDLAYDQTCARWGAAPKARTLADKTALLEALVKGIDSHRGTPTPAPSSGWKALPVVTKVLADGDTSSFQNTAPVWTSSGMHIVMPATGHDSTAVNVPPAGDGIQRCEVTVAGEGGITSGRRFFRFVWELGKGFPSDVSDWEVLAQWKGDGSGSPPLSIETRGGNFVLTWHELPTDPVGAPVVIGPATAGIHDVIVDVTFSTSAPSSPVSTWIDGRQTVTGAKVGATLYSGKADRLKTGLYRSSAIARPADLTLRGFTAGSSFSAVTS